MSIDKLVVRGAREHNLKNVSIELPRDSLVVFTGLSGSGKSSLAFDTIFADVKLRDERDMGRADSPLKPAEDAHLLDTSDMSIEAAFLAAKTLIDAALTK